MTTEEYRAHPSDHYSRLKLALTSAAHFNNPPEPPVDGNPAMVKGTMLHSYILEGKWTDYVTRPKFNPYTGNEKDTWWTTRKWCKQWTSEQTLPILKEEEIEDQLGMRQALQDNEIVQEILSSCPKREFPVLSNYKGMNIKALLDGAGHDNSGNRVIFDLKSTFDTSPDGFSRTVSQQKYPLQLALYSTALSLAEQLEQRPSWLWIAVESKRPYNVGVYSPTPEHYDLGQRQLDYCVNLVQKCRGNGTWPGYTTGITELPWRKWDDFIEPVSE